MTAVAVGLFCLTSCNLQTQGAPDDYTAGCDTGQLIDAIEQDNSDPGPGIVHLAVNCEYQVTEQYDMYVFEHDNYGIRSYLPSITSKITVLGNGSTIKGYFNGVFFYVRQSGDLTIQDITLRNWQNSFGGAVLVDRGIVKADNAVFDYNRAVDQQTGSGGALYNHGGRAYLLNGSTFTANHASGGSGGAIFNDNGFLLIVDSVFSGNDSGDGGGAVASIRNDPASGNEGVLITNASFSENSSGKGGAIHAENEQGIFIVTNSEFLANAADNKGGAISNWSSNLDVAGSIFQENTTENCGGAIDSSGESALTVNHDGFQSNSSTGGNGGGICHDGDSLRITNTNFALNYARLIGGGLYATSTAEIENSVFDQNTADGSGGGVFSNKNLDVSGSTISNNLAVLGGGIYLGPLPDESFPWIYAGIVESTVKNNRTIGQERAKGGGVYFEGRRLDVERSAFHDNWGYAGGGLYVQGGNPMNANGTLLNVENSTISENDGQIGAGIFLNEVLEQSYLLHVTMADNTSSWGDAALTVSGLITIQSSIIANGNLGGHDCLFLDAGPLIPSGATVVGANIDSDDTCGFSLDAGFWTYRSLSDNGGPTLTNSIYEFGPAADAALDCGGLATDQRGEVRPYGPACDIGAYEAGPLSTEVAPRPLRPTPGLPRCWRAYTRRSGRRTAGCPTMSSRRWCGS